MNADETKRMFEKALSLMREGKILEAFDLYCDILTDQIEESEKTFSLFFRTQLCKYLKSKRSLYLSLPEADMIRDLIFSSYEEFLEEVRENPFIKTESGKFRLLMAIKIVFPVQIDTEDFDFPLSVSK